MEISEVLSGLVRMSERDRYDYSELNNGEFRVHLAALNSTDGWVKLGEWVKSVHEDHRFILETAIEANPHWAEEVEILILAQLAMAFFRVNGMVSTFSLNVKYDDWFDFDIQEGEMPYTRRLIKDIHEIITRHYKQRDQIKDWVPNNTRVPIAMRTNVVYDEVVPEALAGQFMFQTPNGQTLFIDHRVSLLPEDVERFQVYLDKANELFDADDVSTKVSYLNKRIGEDDVIYRATRTKLFESVVSRYEEYLEETQQ